MSKQDKTLDRFWNTPLRDLLKLLDATRGGLSSGEAKQRLRVHGPNSLEKESRVSAVLGFLRLQAP